jgi:hypothetical protein
MNTNYRAVRGNKCTYTHGGEKNSNVQKQPDGILLLESYIIIASNDSDFINLTYKKHFIYNGPGAERATVHMYVYIYMRLHTIVI